MDGFNAHFLWLVKLLWSTTQWDRITANIHYAYKYIVKLNRRQYTSGCFVYNPLSNPPQVKFYHRQRYLSMAISINSVRVVANFSSFSVYPILSSSFFVSTSLEEISGNRHDDAWTGPTIGRSSEIQCCVALTSFLRASKLSFTSAMLHSNCAKSVSCEISWYPFN